jgi:hypothetical protein
MIIDIPLSPDIYKYNIYMIIDIPLSPLSSRCMHVDDSIRLHIDFNHVDACSLIIRLNIHLNHVCVCVCVCVRV